MWAATSLKHWSIPIVTSFCLRRLFPQRLNLAEARLSVEQQSSQGVLTNRVKISRFYSADRSRDWLSGSGWVWDLNVAPDRPPPSSCQHLLRHLWQGVSSNVSQVTRKKSSNTVHTVAPWASSGTYEYALWNPFTRKTDGRYCSDKGYQCSAYAPWLQYIFFISPSSQFIFLYISSHSWSSFISPSQLISIWLSLKIWWQIPNNLTLTLTMTLRNPLFDSKGFQRPLAETHPQR